MRRESSRKPRSRTTPSREASKSEPTSSSRHSRRRRKAARDCRWRSARPPGTRAPESASPSATRYFLSINSLFDAGDTPLTPDHGVPQLDAGISHSASFSIAIPPNTPTGSYGYIIAKADATNVVAETNESNNTSTRSIQIGGDLAARPSPLRRKPAPAPRSRCRTRRSTRAPDRLRRARPASICRSTRCGTPATRCCRAVHDVPTLDTGISHTASTTVGIPADQATGIVLPDRQG